MERWLELLGGVLALLLCMACATPPRPKVFQVSDNVTYVCVGFTASWCDATWRQDDPSPVLSPWKVCGVEIMSRPTVPVVRVSDENTPCGDYKRRLRDHPPTTPTDSAPSPDNQG